VTCNYADGDTTEELHLPGEGAFTFLTQPQENVPTPPSELPKDSLSPEGHDHRIEILLGQKRKLHDTDEVYTITQDDMDWLHYFKDKTVFTIGTAQSVYLYRHLVTDMLCAPVRTSLSTYRSFSTDTIC
jgi:hypothetical protein